MAPLTLLSSSKSSQTETESEGDEARDGSLDYKGRPAMRSLTGAWKACLFVLWYHMVERISHYGITSNLVTYLTTELCEGTSESAKNVNNWSVVCSLASIIAAFVADAYLGQYCVIALMSIVYILGLLSLTLLGVLQPFKSVLCDSGQSITTIQAASVFSSLYLTSIGSGVMQPCLVAFGADQFDDTDPVERQRKSSFFTWWSFGTCIGSLFSLIVVVYIQDNVGWGASFGLITVAMFISGIIFLAATPLYRSKPPSGSPFTSIVQVLVVAVCKWNVKVPENKMLLYDQYEHESLQRGRRKLLHTEELGFLDKAATKVTWKQSQPTPDELHASLIVDKEKEEDGFNSRMNPWKLCSVTQVEEVKLIVRVIPIWMTAVVFVVAVVQAQTFFIRQGITMDRKISSHFTIPAASLLSVSMLVNLILLPIYERVFVPIARRLTGNERGIKVLQRVGIGMFFNIIMMLAAALTERKRLKAAEENGLIDNTNATIPMTIFWLLPQYVLYGISYVFAVVGLQEFFYDQMPDTMKSTGMALVYCSFGSGSLLSSFLITLVDTVTNKYGGGQSWFGNNLNRCHLDYFYWLIAVLSTLNFCFYLLAAHYHVYKKIA